MATIFDELKPCMFCGQQIQQRSVRCIHCLKELPQFAAGKNFAGLGTRIGMVLVTVSIAALSLHQTGWFRTPSGISPGSGHDSPAYSLKELDSRLNSESVNDQGASAKEQASYNEEELNGSVDEWTRTILANPKNANAYLERGWAYNQLQEYDNAVYDLSKSIKLNPNVSEAYSKRAWVYDTLGEYQKAVKDANTAIRLDRHNTEAYEARACAYGSLGEAEKAAQDSAKSEHIQLK
jgi:tetratricopeptide (TPR) repeat protein